MIAPALTHVPVPTRSTPVADLAAIYDGTVAHRRHGHRGRQFEPRLFLAYLDVDALPGSLDGLPLWSARRAAPVHFRRSDYFDGAAGPLGDAVRDLVAERLGRRPAGSVYLLAHLRTFGWLFNPLAVYYCWSPDGIELDAVVLEVSNTPWGERCWYVFDAREAIRGHAPKVMHVSPYLPMDVDYRVAWTVPDTDLSLSIEVGRDGTQLFDARLALRRASLSRFRAAWVLARYPLMPLRGSVAIYRQALLLFLRRTPFFRHRERQS